MANVLTRLARTIESRIGEDERKSYAAKLFKRGPEKCAEKFGEEAVEAIIAATKGDKKNLKEEAADVIFHMFVMLSSRGVRFEDVLEELERREGKSGIVEKRERGKKGK
jgi:phosphoribosyl-ATP pyrophosphohydrolase